MTRAVDISADGQWALSGNHDGQVILWNANTGQEIQRFGEEGPAVMAVAFSPDGQSAVSVDNGSQVTLWDVLNGTKLRRFEGHTYGVLDVAFSPDGSKLVTCSGDPSSLQAKQDNAVRLWDVNTGEELRRFEGHTDAVRTVAFSPDGALIASGSGNTIESAGDNSIRIWQVTTGEQRLSLEGHTDYVSSLAFSPDGYKLVSGSRDATVRSWDMNTGEEISRFDMTSLVNAVAFSPDGQTLIGVTEDGTIQAWDALTGEEMYQLTESDIQFVNLAVTADGRSLLASSSNGDLYLWKLNRNIDELLDWVSANRYVRDLTCEEREQYRVEPLCTEAAD